MATVNYASQYAQVLQQKYSMDMRFNALYNSPQNGNYKWSGGKSVLIPRIDVTGMVNVNRDAIGSFTRTVDNNWETKTLTHDREWSTLLDPMDVDETNVTLTIANATRVMNEEQKIPEMDKYMASKIYTDFVTTFSQTADTTALTASNILTVFDGFMEDLDEAEAPMEGRILYVTPAINTLLKTASGLTRQIDVGDGGSGNVGRSISRLDDVQIVVVPSARMYTSYNFTTGAVPAVGSFQMNMILIHPTAIISPQKYDLVTLESPSALSRGKYLYYERLYWDVFVLQRKVQGIAINRGTVATT